MVAKDDKTVQARLKKAQRKKVSLTDTGWSSECRADRCQDTERGTLYIGRIPHGFYEGQMKEYFSQFGDVTRLRLARNRKVRKDHNGDGDTARAFR
jgi:nucleolar protein 15